jgi:hypothetical protein
MEQEKFYKLDFKDKTFGDFLNYTVRKGEKWFLKAVIGDIVLVDVPIDNIYEEEDENIECMAVVTDIGKCLFKDLPGKVYEFEHSDKCRDKKGLVAAMNHAYGEQEWDNEIVTYIGFVITEENVELKVE